MAKYQHYLIFVLLILLTGVWIFVLGCGKTKSKEKKELLIYCDITMIKPMAEFAQIIEE